MAEGESPAPESRPAVTRFTVGPVEFLPHTIQAGSTARWLLVEDAAIEVGLVAYGEILKKQRDWLIPLGVFATLITGLVSVHFGFKTRSAVGHVLVGGLLFAAVCAGIWLLVWGCRAFAVKGVDAKEQALVEIGRHSHLAQSPRPDPRESLAEESRRLEASRFGQDHPSHP